jgi:RNA polymerase sigma-70 factor (ECF subfamily)
MACREDETSMGGLRREFETTLWTIVVNAKDPASPERRQALQKLIETYWKPLYHYVRRKGHDSEASKDAVQSFFTSVMEKDLLQYVQPGRAKFRTFLMLALKHHMSDAWDRATAHKRGGASRVVTLDFSAAENDIADAGPRTDSPDQAFRREWGSRVLEQALDALRADFGNAGRGAEFEAFKNHLGTTQDEKRSYADLADDLNMTEGDIRNRIHRARSRYRELVVAVIRSYCETPAQVDEEIRDLFSALS